MHSKSNVGERLVARPQPLSQINPGERFLIPGIGRRGRVVAAGADGEEVLCELAANEGTTPSG